jgi:hypothetical protein
MDIAIILTKKYSTSLWTLEGDSYEGLNWLSDTPKPTQEELEDLWPEVQAEVAAKAQAKIDAKSSAIAKLEALGLTVEEVEVAFGLTA